jgi:hypothetical protein
MTFNPKSGYHETMIGPNYAERAVGQTNQAEKNLRIDRMVKWRQWFHVCERMHSAIINFYAKSSDDISDNPDERMIQDAVPLHRATAIGSKTRTGLGSLGNAHQVMLDLDGSHVYVPSNTEGHAHLIFRKHVSWEKYIRFLRACVDVGILEPGYVHAAESRGETWLRTPWTAKGEDGNVPEVFGPEQDWS